MSRPRILFLGMEGRFSVGPLEALLEAGYDVAAVALPRLADPAGGPLRGDLPRQGDVAPPARRLPGRALPLMAPLAEQGITDLARERGIPVLELGLRALAAPHTLALLGNLTPTIVCVACFPRLLPRPLLDLAPHGALNVHPSLLPTYRGPAPLFWIFHDGLEHAGVTVHLMDEGPDSGPIVAQAPIALPDGITYAAAERLCAQQGGRLLVEAVEALHAGTARPRPQPPAPAPRAPTPREQDYVASPTWPARRAFNFIRGVASPDRPIVLDLLSGPLPVRSAGAYDEQGLLPGPLLWQGPSLMVRCTPGTLTVTPAERGGL